MAERLTDERAQRLREYMLSAIVLNRREREEIAYALDELRSLRAARGMCATCRHWDRDRQRDGFADCALITDTDRGVNGADKALSAPWAGADGFVTRSDSGCTLHEAAPERAQEGR